MRVLYFHNLRQAVGREAEEIAEPPATVAALLEALTERHEGLRAHLPSLLVAINDEWAGRDASLRPDDEVALMPPLSGG